MHALHERVGTRNLLLLILLLGMSARVIAATQSRGHLFDLDLLGQWGWTLSNHRLDEFYFFAKNPDHLPGDLWFHWMLSTVFQLFGGQSYWDAAYYFILRMLPSITDAIVAYLIFHIVRNLVSAQSGTIAAALFFLNPGIAFVSGVWGQWDSVSMAVLLAGLAIVVAKPNQWVWAVPFIAWATVIKPPLALPGLLIIALPLLLTVRDRTSNVEMLKRMVFSLVATLVLGMGTIVIICFPFSVGLPGMATNWTIFERAEIALDMYPAKTLSATNFWMLSQASFDQVDDRNATAIGLTSQALGNFYLAISFIVAALLLVLLVFKTLRDKPYLALAWSMVAVTFCTFMLPTRVHERYLFPTIVLLIVFVSLIGINWTGLLTIIAISGGFLANLAFVYFGFNHDDFKVQYGEELNTFLLRLVSIVNILLFVVILAMPLSWLRFLTPENRPAGQFNRIRNLLAR